MAGCATMAAGPVATGPPVTVAEEARTQAQFESGVARFRHAAEQRVGAVAARLLPAMGAVPPVGFQLLRSGEVNAYARGGTVFVTLGMMRFAKNDDELALVLGHEIGHLMGEKRRAADVSPQERERMADYLALLGLQNAGYDILAACEVWRRMATELVQPPIEPQAVGAAPWSSSHPTFAERYLRAHKFVESLRGGNAPPPIPAAQPEILPAPPETTHSLR